MIKQRWLLIVMLMIITLLGGCSDPKDVKISVKVPLEVKLGEEFVIIASVKNTAPQTQKLVSLDIADAYLKGVAILRTEPDSEESTHIIIDNTFSYVYNIPIKPGKTVTVSLFAKAIKTGDFNAELDYCINSDYSFLSRSLRTIVK